MKKCVSFFLLLALLLCLCPLTPALAVDEQILTPNQPLTSCLTSNKDSKNFLLQLPESGSLELSFRFVPKGNYYVTLYILEDDGTLSQLQKTHFSFSGETVTGTVKRTANKLRLPAGDYYVKVTPFSTNYCSEDFTLTAVYEEEPDSSFEKEFNGSAAHSMKLRPNRPVTGNLGSDYDEDYYSFELMESSSVQISFRFDQDGSYYVTLYRVDDGGGLQQHQKTHFSNNSGSELGFVNRTTEKLRLPAGLYFVKVSPFSSTACNADYALTVNAREEPEDSFEKEFNNSGATATPIETGVEITGNLAEVDQKDYFHFTMDVSAAVSIQLRYDPYGCYYLTVYRSEPNGDLTQIMKTRFAPSSRESINETIVNTLDPLDLSAGDYYIMISLGEKTSSEDYFLTVLH